VNVTSKPSSAFTISGKACIDSTYSFGSATTVSAVPTNWYWNFGDGQSANITSSNTASHNYTSPATNLLVRHAVTYGGCPSDTTDQLIPVIVSNPNAAFSISSGSRCENIPLMFTGSASADVSLWSWDFGNGIGSGALPFSRVYNTAGAYSVKLTVQNAQGCKFVAAPVPLNITVAPNVEAGPDIYLTPGNSKIISASIANATAYDFLWTPSTALNATDILNPVTSTQNPLTYFVTATDRVSGCTDYDSVSVKIITEIFVPGAFSPNGDGTNDTWGIPALQGYPEAMVTVYNRYGQIIYQSKGYNKPWDGTFRGTAQPVGTYVYFIKPSAADARYLKGTVTLIR
jgi:gliding motility-associated-like protein